MSSENLQEILKRIQILTPDEKMFLANRLLHQIGSPDPTSGTDSEGGIDATRAKLHTQWIKAHQQEYAGRYVALDGDRLLAEGRTFREVSEAARETGHPRPFITFVPNPDVTYFGGW